MNDSLAPENQNPVIREIAKICKSWEQLSLPNDELANYDLKATDHVFREAKRIGEEGLDPAAHARNLLRVLTAPNLDGSNRDYSWLVVYWHVNQLGAALTQCCNDEIVSPAVRPMIAPGSIELYHAEISEIKENVQKISAELKELTSREKTLSGVSVGAFGVSVSVETIQAALKRVTSEITKPEQGMSITAIVDALSSLYETSKAFLSRMLQNPSKELESISHLARSVTASAGASLVTALRIRRSMTKPAPQPVVLRLASHERKTPSAQLVDMAAIVRLLRSIRSRYQSQIFDHEYFEGIQSAFRKFEFLVEVDGGRRLRIAAVAPDQENWSINQDVLRFSLKVDQRDVTFAMSPDEYLGHVINLIDAVIQNFDPLPGSYSPTAGLVQINLSDFGGMFSVSRGGVVDPTLPRAE